MSCWIVSVFLEELSPVSIVGVRVFTMTPLTVSMLTEAASLPDMSKLRYRSLGRGDRPAVMVVPVNVENLLSLDAVNAFLVLSHAPCERLDDLPR